MLLVDEIKLKLDEGEDKLKAKVLSKLDIKDNELISLKIDKKSLDLRKDEAYLIYRLKVELKNEEKVLKRKLARPYIPYKTIKKVKTDKKFIIVGDGPAGLFCASTLADAGISAIVIEKGKKVKDRQEDIDYFLKSQKLNESSNIQFGEGGAGLFSDAKLTTRIKDPYIEYILEKFVSFGADQKIMIDNHPHVGTDKISKVIENLREDLIKKGIDFHFEEEMLDVIKDNNKVIGIKTDKAEYFADYIIIAIGHSSKLFEALHNSGIYIESKDFSIGFRVEHPQSLINQNQYKGLDIKDSAEYFLRYTSSFNRGVYSFCMCPGGYIIPASSEAKTIVTNGMSYSKRDNDLANSAILCQVTKRDYGSDLFSGYNYIRDIEKKAYAISNSYRAPSQNIKDFLNDEVKPLIYKSSYPFVTIPYNINDLFNQEISKSFKEAFINFDKKINGFIDKGIIIAPETRSTSPFRIKRNPDFRSISHSNVYPIGEGAGYGGGIMSCALDGVKCALSIINSFI